MSLLLRAAVLGGIAFLITRSLSNNTPRRALAGGSGHRSSPLRELHPGENHVWPTSESQPPASANAGPGA